MFYEICADEAWTHGGVEKTRYWCFFGGLFGNHGDIDRLEKRLKGIRQQSSQTREVKWSNVSPGNIGLYKDLTSEFFGQIKTRDLKYRQMFLDRRYVYVPSKPHPERSALDVQFLVYYQFLKHCFGIEHLPRSMNTDRITIRLDRHSSQRHKGSLMSHVSDLPARLGRSDLIVGVKFVNSEKYLRMQVCDLVVGAAGSHGNKMHLRRQSGQRGMTAEQRCRNELAKHVYGHLCELNTLSRGSKAFNWFESTGRKRPEDLLNHKVRIWKFRPQSYDYDDGWMNRNLDNQGRYKGSIIVPICSLKKTRS